MAFCLTPHSSEWFDALLATNPQQAIHTAQIIRSAGHEAVCSICGDEPARDYRVDGQMLVDRIVATIRLCNDCRSIRRLQYGERYSPL